MRRLIAPIVLLPLLAALCFGDMKLKGEKEYAPYKKIVLKATDVTSAKAQFLWDVDGDADVVEDGGTLYVWAKPGTYKVRLTAVDFDNKKIERATTTFTVTGEGPAPGPTPPGPTPPGPTPPGPTPPAPISGDGLRVLIVEEPADRASLPATQYDLLFSKTFQDFLTSNTAKDSDNKNGAWRIWPAKANTKDASQSWQDAMKRERKSLPWIIVSNGKTGFEGPLPKTEEEATNLVKKYMPVKAKPKRAKR